MNWTKEIPTLDGWYWIHTGWDFYLAEIRSGCTWVDACKVWKALPKDGYNFYGPLEEPK